MKVNIFNLFRSKKDNKLSRKHQKMLRRINKSYSIIKKEKFLSGFRIANILYDLLKDTSEEDPKQVDIILEVPGGFGLSTNMLPHLTQMWYDKETKDVHVLLDEVGYLFSELYFHEQIQIINELVNSKIK